MKQIINATPHAIKVERNGEIVIFQPSDFVARVKMNTVELAALNGFKLSENIPGIIEGLPTEDDDAIFIVSAMVLSANKETENPRLDLIAPDTGATAVRNEKGHIEYVLGFIA
ncbi:MAG: hypothetical protein ACRCX8_12860 [Sarcina sp.]